MNYAVFDIEAENWLHFKVLGFYDGTDYKNFFSVSDFLDYIDRRKYRRWRFYAHNGGKYDDNFLYEELFKRNWQMKFIERSSRMICVYVKTPHTEFSLVDSYAALPASLKELGIAFDVEHKKSEYNFEGKINAHDATLLKYLENDCLCLTEVLQKYFANDLIVEPQLTIASQALNTFTQKFVPGKLYRVSLPFEEAFRKYFYRGGRVEVYKGHGTTNEYDVNSLFPFAMLERMPVGDCKKVRTYNKDKIGFYAVHIPKFPKQYITPLLVYANKKTYFVNGPGLYYLSSATLNFLQKEFGISFEVQWGLQFEGAEYLCNEYVNTLYELKRTNKGNALYFIAKTLMNALYGKFGQARWRDSVETRTAKHKEGFSSFNDEYGLILVPKESHNQFILPYLAAYITELGRLHHYKLMLEAPGEMFYCDIDSLFTSHDYSNFVGDRIGQLSFNGRWESIFLAPKSYARRNDQEEKIKFKGFAAKNFTWKDFDLALRKGKTLSSEDWRILSFRECVGSYGKDGKFRKPRAKGIIDEASPFLKRAKIDKEVKSPYIQRKVIPSPTYGFDTVPYTFSEVCT